MKKEAIQSFATRITQASRSELVVIMYEMILAKIDEAERSYMDNDLKTYDHELKGAQRYVSELMSALDYSYKISYDLLSLYLYTNKHIITAIVKQNPQTLQIAKEIINKLLTGFEGVSKADNSGPMMRNTQRLYAGLTYGKGSLNETFIDPNNKNRGFIA
ncbi:MAG: flagellar protein FliS [Clostridiales bacterium]|jgi:flagellar protein FliS|nr:flagellar protein FliS [Bacillota bacterium]NLK04089.1 flagellar protein FliS [Clostridiales bacterium]